LPTLDRLSGAVHREGQEGEEEKHRSSPRSVSWEPESLNVSLLPKTDPRDVEVCGYDRPPE
jgi:hypothetical protein